MTTGRQHHKHCLGIIVIIIIITKCAPCLWDYLSVAVAKVFGQLCKFKLSWYVHGEA